MDQLQLQCTSPCPYCHGSAKINHVTLSKDEVLHYDYICDCGYIHKKTLPITYLGSLPPIVEQETTPHICLKCANLMVQGSLQGDGTIEYAATMMSCKKGHFVSVSELPSLLPKDCTL